MNASISVVLVKSLQGITLKKIQNKSKIYINLEDNAFKQMKRIINLRN